VELPVDCVLGSSIAEGSFRECFLFSIKSLPNHSLVGKRFKDVSLNSESHIYDLKSYMEAKEILGLFANKLIENKEEVAALLDKGKFQLITRYCR
jgi:hypothetical protein